MDLRNRNAIVTGAGSGIGKACALALLRAGWNVALAGRRANLLDDTIHEAGDAPARAIAVPTDVTDERSVHALFERTVAEFGRLDLLFNNAGVGAPPATIDEVTLDQWRAVVDVNLTGMFLCAREAFRAMKAQSPRGGRIVNNGSISAHVPRPRSVAYTATKHAVTGLTRQISLDGRAHDIACGQIDIGNAATELARAMSQGVQQASGALAPEPTMDVRDVASTLVHMASLPPEANVQFVTVMATKMPFIGRG
ncbi:MAG: SDR family oxidoreductase [Burkholderiaceae bacterium]|nr:SDR family oxidoreductase [Burkholderiaceae bacterium]